MPCFDHRDHPYSRHVEEIDSLRERNHELMRAICKIDRIMGFTDEQLRSFGREVRSLILSHRKADRNR